MHKAPFAHIDPGMRGSAAAEDHQIAAAQLAGGNGLAEIVQLRHGARRCHAGAALVDISDESAAIKAAVGRVAAVAVRRADQSHRVDGDVIGLFGREARNTLPCGAG